MEYRRYDTTRSTQSLARETLSSLPKDRIVCFSADFQEAGHGPRKTGWLCPRGTGILATFVVWQKIAPQLAHIACLSVTELLASYGVSPKIKWPNDVLINGKKCAGCMVEGVGGALLIGIGVNLLQTPHELSEIDQPATSLACETATPCVVDTALEHLGRLLEHNLRRFKEEGFDPFLEMYRSRSAFSRGERICVRQGDRHVSVTFLEIQKDGRLLVADETRGEYCLG